MAELLLRRVLQDVVAAALAPSRVGCVSRTAAEGASLRHKSHTRLWEMAQPRGGGAAHARDRAQYSRPHCRHTVPPTLGRSGGQPRPPCADARRRRRPCLRWEELGLLWLPESLGAVSAG